MAADLHTHTLYSDGILSPEQLLAKAKAVGLRYLSITDHDTMDGYLVASSIAGNYGIELIPGIELSCYESGTDHHLLGYFLDPDYPRLREHLRIFQRERIKRAERIISKLNILEVNIHVDDVVEKAGNASIGRPHIAAELVQQGYVRNMKSAFDQYLADGKPAYVGKPLFPVSEGIDLINQAGGVAILAHPGGIGYERFNRIVDHGLDGVEVIHPSHPLDVRVYYHNLALHYWLLETGGSDFHGSRTQDETNFGKYVVQDSAVEAMINRIAKR